MKKSASRPRPMSKLSWRTARRSSSHGAASAPLSPTMPGCILSFPSGGGESIPRTFPPGLKGSGFTARWRRLAQSKKENESEYDSEEPHGSSEVDGEGNRDPPGRKAPLPAGSG